MSTKKSALKQRMFAIKKYVMATTLSEALKKEKTIDPDEIYPVPEKKAQGGSSYAVGFNAEIPDEDEDDNTD